MPSHQKIIRFIYEKKRKCCFTDQDIYKNRKAFNRAMRFLEKNNIILITATRINGNFLNLYELTDEGKLLFEEILSELK